MSAFASLTTPDVPETSNGIFVVHMPSLAQARANRRMETISASSLMKLAVMLRKNWSFGWGALSKGPQMPRMLR